MAHVLEQRKPRVGGCGDYTSKLIKNVFSFKCEHCDQGKAKKQRKTKKPRSKEANNVKHKRSRFIGKRFCTLRTSIDFENAGNCFFGLSF